MVIDGRCHCGNVGFALTWEPDPVEIPARACTCSFCVAHGGVWTGNSAASLAISIANPDLVSRYIFGTRTAEFHVCSRCGVVPVATSTIDGRLYAVVNVNTFHGIDPGMLRRTSATFDAETEATRLARRARNWIGTVTYGGG